MLNKNQNNYILKYNNYQFYENDALNEFLNKQAENGMFFSGFEGSFCNRFKFRYSKKELPKSYIMLHKHLDNQIDQEIEKKKMQNEKIVSEGNRYIVFETVPTKVPDMDAEIGLDILSKWLICSIGFTFWIRLRPSYLSLLMFGALLACFQFG